MTLRFIAAQPEGRILVYLEMTAPHHGFYFLYYRWDNGWKLVDVDEHI